MCCYLTNSGVDVQEFSETKNMAEQLDILRVGKHFHNQVGFSPRKPKYLQLVGRNPSYYGEEDELEKDGWHYIKTNPWPVKFCLVEESIETFLGMREFIQAPRNKKKKLLRIEEEARFRLIFETPVEEDAFKKLFSHDPD
jgi:hypothetical protein